MAMAMAEEPQKHDEHTPPLQTGFVTKLTYIDRGAESVTLRMFCI